MATPSPSDPVGVRPEVAVFLNEYVGENIRFADTKAGFAVTVVGVFLAALFSQEINWAAQLTSPSTCVSGLVAWGFLLVAGASIALGLAVVFPRTGNKPAKGLIFWENVVQHGSAQDFGTVFLSTPEVELVRLLAEQHFYLCQTANRKYRVLRWLVPASGATVVLGTLALLIL